MNFYIGIILAKYVAMKSYPRKIHPMLLIAAVAVTIFSLLSSALISGLLPLAQPQQGWVQSLTDNTGVMIANAQFASPDGNYQTSTADVAPPSVNLQPVNLQH